MIFRAERPETSLPDFSLATNCDKKPVSCILIRGDQTDVGFWQREGFLRSSWSGTQIYCQHEGGRACFAVQEGSFLPPAHVIGMAMNVEQEKLVSRNSCNAIEQKVFSFRCRRRRRPWLGAPKRFVYFANTENHSTYSRAKHGPVSRFPVTCSVCVPRFSSGVAGSHTQ